MRILVDATAVIALGSVGELDRLAVFDGDVEIPPEVRTDVTSEPAATNLESALESRLFDAPPQITDDSLERAMDVLAESERNGDVRLVADVLRETEADRSIGVVSDDRRVRTVCRGFGATVTGTIGVVVRAVEDGLSASEGNTLVRRIDDQGLHMTGELRERADDLIDEAAKKN